MGPIIMAYGRIYASLALVALISCHGAPVQQQSSTTAPKGELVQEGTQQAAANPKYVSEFVPHPIELEAPPPIAGSAAQYGAQAKRYADMQDRQYRSSLHDHETSVGLKAAAAEADAAEEADTMATVKAKVQKEFNEAAARGAEYRDKAHQDDMDIVAVKQAVLTRDNQEKLVSDAELTLKKARQTLKSDDRVVDRKRRKEQEAKFAAEAAGEKYESEKAKAVNDKRRYDQKVKTSELQGHYRDVAKNAIAKARAQEEAKQSAFVKERAVKQAPPPQVKAMPTKPPPKTPPKKAAACHDCTVLPAKFKAKGGTCADCVNWAKHGRCTDAPFKSFMHHYCAASCGCPHIAVETTLLELMPSAVLEGSDIVNEEETAPVMSLVQEYDSMEQAHRPVGPGGEQELA